MTSSANKVENIPSNGDTIAKSNQSILPLWCCGEPKFGFYVEIYSDWLLFVSGWGFLFRKVGFFFFLFFFFFWFLFFELFIPSPFFFFSILISRIQTISTGEYILACLLLV